ncbi:hypothetical protein NEOLI_000863 [Neolecta irregularis DAH-3]|uniref:PHD-type domain-containing protein n=1 Tax=Neolecta irregularis (strain DAH-3) TaxID=1198029 RepID=A0A1U7LL03_NEOID|nr:hypothetical protein NEOLI_000863 [Neolecta irregularis DAH-3]|eukprot:OLL23273.1 hypothetical protein NEOLI_000863 [Neolecta irregularis DAH-3]
MPSDFDHPSVVPPNVASTSQTLKRNTKLKTRAALRRTQSEEPQEMKNSIRLRTRRKTEVLEDQNTSNESLVSDAEILDNIGENAVGSISPAVSRSETPISHVRDDLYIDKATVPPLVVCAGKKRTRDETNRSTEGTTPPPARAKRQRKIKVNPPKDRGNRPNGFAAVVADHINATSGPRFFLCSGNDDIKDNDDFCAACRGPGRFICCDSCPRSYHVSCIEPPIEETDLAENAWFCRECWVMRHPPDKPPRSIFSELLFKMNKRNPALFVLPDSIRNFFQGVSTGSHGEYVDTSDLKILKANRHGFLEEPDLLRLKDKQGDSILCYKCQMSAVHGGRIISCDYCSLHWHLDCLDPPMTSIPSQTRRWMCPNHSEHLIKRRRKPKITRVVDVSLNRGFKNNGDIEIDNEEEDEDPWEDEFNVDGVRYRLPERGIKLDFIERVQRKSSRTSSEQTDTMRSMLSNLIESRQGSVAYTASSIEEELEHRSDLERQVLHNLALMSFQPPEETRSSLKVLLQVALSELSVDKPSDKSSDISFSSQERAHLLAVKNLIQLKGEDALLQFLSS